MRIVLLLPAQSLYANLIAKELIREFGQSIVMIVDSGVLIPGYNLWGSLGRYLKVSGFNYLFCQAAEEYLFKTFKFVLHGLFRSRKEESLYYSFKNTAKKLRIPIIYTDEINSRESLEQIRQTNPDLVISIYFRQILRKNMLSLPRLGTINIHPALLPDYRGVSPVFWALANAEKEAGVTVHFLDEGVDRGAIISQARISILPDDTEHSLFLKATLCGIPLLKEAVRLIQENRNGFPVQPAQAGRYFSIPTAEAVRRFSKNGRRFFRLADFFKASVGEV